MSNAEEDVLNKLMDAIEDVFGDTSIPAEGTMRVLKTGLEQLQEKIDALKADGVSP